MSIRSDIRRALMTLRQGEGGVLVRMQTRSCFCRRAEEEEGEEEEEEEEEEIGRAHV